MFDDFRVGGSILAYRAFQKLENRPHIQYLSRVRIIAQCLHISYLIIVVVVISIT